MGRRALEAVSGFSMLEDFVWHEDQTVWFLPCRITAEVESGGLVPSTTDWYLHVQKAYPYGTVAFYPAKDRGITVTFNHQNHNSPGCSALPWRSGRLCVDTSLRSLGRYSYDTEPFDAESRLVWHALRVQEWLCLASRGELVQAGNLFEMPDIPTSPGLKVVFTEGPENLSVRQGTHARHGMVEFRTLQETPQILLVDDFIGKGEAINVPTTWTKRLGKANDLDGAWIWLNRLPIVKPWTIPTTWEELRQCCQAQGINLDDLLKRTVRALRDGNQHLLLVGFPIPAKVQGPLVQAHWLALSLPILTHRSEPGFRASERSYWLRDHKRIFGDTKPLKWVKTENWHQDEISGRGRMHPLFRSKSVLVIGGGAVGAALAEVLVRSGVQRVTIMDHDCLEAGNLVRHTLGVSHLGQPKASSLAARLNDAAIHSVVSHICGSFPPREQEGKDLLKDADVIIDCTADDKVAKQMSEFDWVKSVMFILVSVGLKARRLFTYVAHGNTFQADLFHDALDPWLRSERNGYDEELPRDGIGCWYALMPARIDDLWMMTTAAMKTIESAVVNPLPDPNLIVFEQQYEDGVFVGLRRVYEPGSIF